MLKILSAPQDVLSTPAQPIVNFDADLKKTVREMETAMLSVKDDTLIGVGLAAPQVGISKMLFIVKPKPTAKTEVFVNAQIVRAIQSTPKVENLKKKRSQMEGCLSIPRLWGPVQRAIKILVEFQDLEGKKHTKEFTGFKAVIIQHEVDHTNGILFTQRVLEQGENLYEEKNGKLKKLSY